MDLTAVDAAGADDLEKVDLELGAAGPVYRLPPRATVTGVGETTLHLRSGTASVLLEGDAEALLAAARQLDRGVPVGAAPRVVERLWNHGVLERETGVSAAEVRRTRLAQSCVLVDGLTPCGEALADLLVRHGVGTVVLRDAAPVDPPPEGCRRHGGGPDRLRAEDLADALAETADGVTVLSCPPDGVVQAADVQVLIRETDAGAPGWPRWEVLIGGLRESRRVLPVLTTADGMMLGPVISDGGPAPCPDCLQRQGSSLGVGGADGGDDGAPMAFFASGAAVWPLQGMAAHLLIHQLGELLAGPQLPALTDAVLWIDGGTGAISARPVPPSSDCPCRAQSELFGSSPESSEPPESPEPPGPPELLGPS